MNQSLRNEIDDCIYELNSIIRQLHDVSYDITHSISGMNTKKYTRSLEKSAEKYQKAVNKLYDIV